jgi:anaerobic selenocysteine-containing dehydrogenase
VRNSAKFSPALFTQEAGSKTDWQIYLGLAERMDKLNGKATEHYATLWQKEPTGVVDDMLKSGRYSKGEHQLSIQTLLEHPHGIDLGPLQSELPEAIYHPDKKIHMAFDYFMGDLPRVERHFFSDASPLDARSANTLDLIGRRHLKSNNSWLHNSPRMMKGLNSNEKGQNPRCSAQIHPDDAQRFNIQDGQFIRVTSRVGQVDIVAELTEKIMPGVISIPHGWGHNKAGSNWALAEQHSGVSVNDLTDEMCLDELSGNAVLNGVPVTIEPL